MKLRLVLLTAILTLTCAMHRNEIPNFKQKNLQKKNVELYQLLEKGPVLLDFWATWCKPCLKAFPKLNALHEKYGDKGLTILGINEDSNRNQTKIKPFVKSLNIQFDVVFDANNALMRQFQISNLPATILISPDRKIISRDFGYSPNKFKKLEKQIISLLEEYNEKKIEVEK
ncbi:MAG: TlpA family protein disulfide reductase [Caldithrix sp.]|nr:MAG: TlpA family protein disulfide reductase [Caldithrix sp.]